MIFIFTLIICIHKSIFTIWHVHCTLLIKGQHEKKKFKQVHKDNLTLISVRAVSDNIYSEGDDNSGRGLFCQGRGPRYQCWRSGSADPGSGSAYFYRDSDPGSALIFKGSARKTVRISNTVLNKNVVCIF